MTPKIVQLQASGRATGYSDYLMNDGSVQTLKVADIQPEDWENKARLDPPVVLTDQQRDRLEVQAAGLCLSTNSLDRSAGLALKALLAATTSSGQNKVIGSDSVVDVEPIDAPARYFVYSPESGYNEYDTNAERARYHQAEIDSYLDDGWGEGVEQVVSGIVTHVTVQTDVQKRPLPCPEHPDHDGEQCDACDEYNNFPDHAYEECCSYKPAPLVFVTASSPSLVGARDALLWAINRAEAVRRPDVSDALIAVRSFLATLHTTAG